MTGKTFGYLLKDLQSVLHFIHENKQKLAENGLPKGGESRILKLYEVIPGCRKSIRMANNEKRYHKEKNHERISN